MMSLLKLLAVLSALALVLAPAAPWFVRTLLPVLRRASAFARRSPGEALVVLLLAAGFIVHGATKGQYQVFARNYSGTYDGRSHAAYVDVWDCWGWGLDYVLYAESPEGPWRYEPPSYVDAGTYTVHYSAYRPDDARVPGTCTVTIAPKRLTAAMVGTVPTGFIYDGHPVEPPVTVADGDLLTTNDYVCVYTNNILLGRATVTVVGLHNYTGSVVRTFEILPPVPEKGLHALGLERTEVPCGEEVSFRLTHDSPTNVLAKVTGLPDGLAFDARTLEVRGVAKEPGVYPVGISATDANGYAWSETVALRVLDRAEPDYIDFSGLPSAATKGEAYRGVLGTDLRGYVRVSGLPPGLKFTPQDGTVAGTPTKAGVYVVTVVQTFLNGLVKTATHTVTVGPWEVPAPVRTAYWSVNLFCDAGLGTVKGAGVHPEGRKVALSAQPAQGMAFAGWYLDAAFTRPFMDGGADYRAARLSVRVAGNLRLYARFIPLAEAVGSVSVSHGRPETSDGDGPLRVSVGVRQSIPLKVDAAAAVQVRVAGLPPGLRYDASTGAIVGVPTLARAATVRVNVSVAGRTLAYTFAIVAEALPPWVAGASFVGAGAVDGVPGRATLMVGAHGRVSGRILSVAGGMWTVSAASLAERTAWGAYVADVVVQKGRDRRAARLWLWGEEIAPGRFAGCFDLADESAGESKVPTVVAEGWQSAFQRVDLADVVADERGRVWTVEDERGTLSFKCGARGLLTVRGTVGGRAVSASSQLVQTGLNYLGEPAYRATVLFHAAGTFKGWVWTGVLNPVETPGGVSPPSVVTTVEDVVDADDGKTSLREALETGNHVTFALPSGVEPKIVLAAPIEIATSKVVDGAFVQRIHGQTVTNRVTISGGGRVRLFRGDYRMGDFTFRNLVLEDGHVGPVGYAPDTCGAVLQATSWGTVTFENCLVRGNYVEGNGAVVDWYGPVVMRGSTFENNHADHMGGVLCLNSGGATAVNCRFTGNYSKTAGAVFRVDGGVVAEGCVFERNDSPGQGGVYFGKGDYASRDSTYVGNARPTFKTYTYLLPGATLPKRSIQLSDCLFEDKGAAQSSYFSLQPDYLLQIDGCIFR